MGAVTPDELRMLLDSNRPVAVLDVREPLDYARGNIRESTLIPRRALEWRVPELVPTDEVTVVVVDDRGERAATDADWLRRLGLPDIRHLAGGVEAWRRAGHDIIEATDGIYASAFNVPSKEFGEKVAVEHRIDRVSPDRVTEWIESDEDVFIADVRTPGEYHKATIPGAVNVEGIDLAAYAEQLRDDAKLVVHCAGRTRSLIGTATLQKRGLEDVYGLENGTSGWRLAGYDLEEGPDDYARHVELDHEESERTRSFAEDLLDESEAPRLSSHEVADLLANDALAYVFDVRTGMEYEEGHIPGSVGVPGGQAIQRVDDYVAVPEALLVFYSTRTVRAAVTAYWYAEMGFEDVAVLDGGLETWIDDDRPIKTGIRRTERLGLQRAVEQQHSCDDPLAWATVHDAAQIVAPDAIPPDSATVLHIGRSDAYREHHLPASRWLSRNDLESFVDREEPVDTVLTCSDGTISIYAAAALAAIGYEVRALRGGVAAWADAGYPVESGDAGIEGEPKDVVPSTDEQGEQSMRGYLEWEERLGEEGEHRSFRYV